MRYTAAVVPVIFQVATAATLLISGQKSGLLLADAPCKGGPITIKENAVRGFPTGAAPSWALFKYPHVYAVDELSNKIEQLTFDSDNTTLSHKRTEASGSIGKVHLELSQDGKHLLAAAFTSGFIDVYSIAEDGTLALVKAIKSTGTPNPKQTGAHPHQASKDGSGQFFFVPDLGTDTVLVIDSKKEFTVVKNQAAPAGCGPRHGAFLSLNEPGASSHYALVCELTSEVILYALDFSIKDTVGFTQLQQISTFGPTFPPVNPAAAAAGEIAISSDNKSLYVSNRLTGNKTEDGVDTDSISVFSISNTEAGVTLALVGQPVSSGGTVPRMFSLSSDAAQKHLFVTNQNAGAGLRVLDRAVDGTLTFGDSIKDFGSPGPQFVQQITLG